MTHPIMKFKLPDGRWDMVGYARSQGHKHGGHAEHCPKCGWFARQLAGDHSVRDKILPSDPEPTGPWYRTDCKRCGVWEVVLEFVPVPEGFDWKRDWKPNTYGWRKKSVVEVTER